MLVDNSASVQITELQTEGGDGELDVGGGWRQADSVTQHAAQLQVTPSASVVVRPALTDSVNALLGDVGPENTEYQAKPRDRLEASYLVSKSRTFILVLTPTQPIYRTA